MEDNRKNRIGEVKNGTGEVGVSQLVRGQTTDQEGSRNIAADVVDWSLDKINGGKRRQKRA